MRCQCNKTRLESGIVGECVRKIGQARRCWSPDLPVPAVQIPPIAWRMVSTLWAKGHK